MRQDAKNCTAGSGQMPSTQQRRRIAAFTGLCLSLVLGWSATVNAQVNVLTRSYDSGRTGANLNETILTPANVNPTNFGKLFTIPTDGQIYAQPLYMSNLTIAGGTHNVVFAASMLNTIYAIDADTGATLWTHNYGTPITPKEVETDQNITWNTGIGILGTPVIDPSTNYMYFATGNETVVNGSNVYSYNLNAIDIFTGNPVLNSPVAISGTYSTPDLTTPLTFVPKKQNQRPGLALGNGNVYIAFASHEDSQPYHGWVFAYSASNLSQVATYSDTTTGIEGGIWNAGGAPTIDANGNVYISTGNGSFGKTPNGLIQTGNSFIKLSPSLELLDYFTPYNSSTLNAGDQDLGSSGLLLLPNTNYLFGGGKQGVLYTVDTTNMGQYNSSADQVHQEFQGIFGKGTSHIHGSPVYWDSAVNGPTTYVWGENDLLRAYTYNPTTTLVNTTALATSTMTAPVTNNDGAMPGGFITISANGGTNGIAWASTPYNGNAVHVSVQGVVYAFDANTLAPLWSDKDNDARDEIGTFAKYTPPVVANGKLYMATFGGVANPNGTGALVVYGLLPTVSVTPSTLTFPATIVGNSSTYQTLTVTNSSSAAVNITAIQLQGTNQSSYGIRQQTCGTSLAAGASCTFSIVFRPNIGGPLPVSVYTYDSASGSPQIVSVTGTGTAVFAVTLSPATLAFPSTNVGSSSAAQQVTLSNTGSAALSITSIALSGANASSYAVSQQTCGASVAAGGSCTFSVTFSPNTTGSLPASVTIADNAANSPQTVSMTATGTGTASPIASLSPATLTFPPTAIGGTAAYQTVTLSNTGTATLNITSIAPSGTNASSYGIRQQTCGTTLAAKASCTFSVAFRPNTSGALPVQIRAYDNAANSPQAVNATGTGNGVTTVALAPSNLAFPATVVGTTATAQQVTVSNTGTNALSISSIAPAGTNTSSYAVVQNTCGATLAGGASCTFSVTFTPATTGSFPSMIAVTDNGNGSPQFVALTGTGSTTGGPGATLSPSTLTFPPTTVGSTAAYQQVTLTNTGSAVLNITSIGPSGTNASNYGIRQLACGSTLAAGASCTFSVAFRPNVTGALPILIRVWDNAPASPQAVSATGTGR
jgi:hypothetical protein